MHELSIALSIVDLASEEAERRGGVRVQAIHLRLGPLSGVVKEALLSAWDLAAEGSAVAGSRLVVEHVPVVVFCPTCQDRRTIASIQQFCCPDCGTPTGEVVSGRELEVFAMEIVE
jgi:hydrogenase nickel incorporation protein HypA/HybF